MARAREPKTFDECRKMIQALAPDKSTVWVEQSWQGHRDLRAGYSSDRFIYRCSILVERAGQHEHLVSSVNAPTPAELVKAVMVEMLKGRERLGLPMPEPPKPAKKQKPKRLAHRQPLLTYQR